MKIAICDDDPIQLNILETTLRQVPLCINAYIITFLSGDAFLASLSTEDNYDLVFLDIQMPGINGFQVYQLAINHSKMLHIPFIFVSIHIERLPEVFSLRAPIFLYKPFDTDTLTRTIQEAFDRKKTNKTFERLMIDGSIKRYFCSHIYYFKAEDHYVSIYSAEKIQLCRDYLNKIETELEDFGFFRCHRSYLVNLKYVNKRDTNTLYIDSIVKAYKIPLSKRRHTLFMQAFLQYKTERLYGV